MTMGRLGLDVKAVHSDVRMLSNTGIVQKPEDVAGLFMLRVNFHPETSWWATLALLPTMPHPVQGGHTQNHAHRRQDVVPFSSLPHYLAQAKSFFLQVDLPRLLPLSYSAKGAVVEGKLRVNQPEREALIKPQKEIHDKAKTEKNEYGTAQHQPNQER